MTTVDDCAILNRVQPPPGRENANTPTAPAVPESGVGKPLYRSRPQTHMHEHADEHVHGVRFTFRDRA